MVWYKITYKVVTFRKALLHGNNIGEVMDDFAGGRTMEDEQLNDVKEERVLEKIAEIPQSEYPNYNIPK